MATVYTPRDRIWQGSNTATTGGTIYLTTVASAGSFNFRDLYTNGSVVALLLYDGTTGVFEFSYGTLVFGGGGAATDSITNRVITYSYSGVATPVAWGAGSRNAVCMVAARSFLLAENGLGELTAPQVTAAQGHLGLVPGTAVGNIVQLLAGTPAKLPVVDGSNLVNLPTTTPIPSGSVTDWYQAAAPSGWTRVTSVNDRVPIIVSAGSPGTTNSSTWAITDLSADAYSLLVSELPSHNHGVGDVALAASGGALSVITPGGGFFQASASTGSGEPHSHNVTSAGTWRPPAAYMLLASKN